MKKTSDVRWTIEQLRDAVATALAEGYDGPPNGRVRDVPDQRTIRYYTTLGLLDRAAEMRGRTAFYGTRHLLQLVAIKKLQAQGQSLAEVQRALIGQTNASLARLAGLGRVPLEERTAPEASPPRAFWKETPAPARALGLEKTMRVGEEPLDARPDGYDRTRTFQGVELATNVTLLLAAARPLAANDLEAIRAASGPLIELLAKLEIIPSPGEGDSG